MSKFSGLIWRAPKFRGCMIVNKAKLPDFPGVDPVLPVPPVVDPDTPDEPVTSGLYLYGTPSTSGNIGLRNGESVTYYDGAVLPDIDTVYTDELKERCPKAVIYDNFGTVARFRVLPTNASLSFSSTGYAFYGSDEYSMLWSCVYSGGKSWNTPEENNDGGGFWVKDAIWANFEIKNGDTLYLAATAPIPVTGEIVEYINGIPIYEVKT